MKKVILYPNLNAELARIGASISDLAEYMDMTSQNLYNKVNGKTTISVKDMKAVQSFFIAKGGGAFTLDYLFKNGE